MAKFCPRSCWMSPYARLFKYVPYFRWTGSTAIIAPPIFHFPPVLARKFNAWNRFNRFFLTLGMVRYSEFIMRQVMNSYSVALTQIKKTRMWTNKIKIGLILSSRGNKWLIKWSNYDQNGQMRSITIFKDQKLSLKNWLHIISWSNNYCL